MGIRSGQTNEFCGQTYFDGLAALLERFADRPPARDRDIDWKFLRRTGRGDSRLALGAFFRSVGYLTVSPIANR